MTRLSYTVLSSHNIAILIRSKMMFAIVLVSLAFGSSLAQDGIFPETVPELEVAKYLGRWFQTYASPVVMETFEKDAVCVTADYGVFNASTLTVYNANRIKTPDGALNDIRGFAFTSDEPGKLTVNLEGTGFDAPYWIIKLGPKTFGPTELYEYAIVTDPFRVTLFVLTRDVPKFRAKFEAEVLNFLKTNGFDSVLNEPIKTYHEKDCQYAPKPSL